MMKKEKTGKEMVRRDMPLAPRTWEFWGWDPLTEFPMMRNMMKDFFGNMFRGGMMPAGEMMMKWQPAMDIYKKDNNIVVEASLPGMKKEDINIDISDGMMTISGEMKEEKEVKENDYYYKERHSGTFSRSMMIPEDIRMDNIDAEFKDGLLKVTMPMTAPEKARKKKVEIK
ncbi:MAG: Hsp20/alpha crystallin family protein [Chloroflexi bacterium]|nr:Hsp20/alpha crystallin family protein [Chloroflexota bacterium]